MCLCNSRVKTPYCGKPGCEGPNSRLAEHRKECDLLGGWHSCRCADLNKRDKAWEKACLLIIDHCVPPEMYPSARSLLNVTVQELRKV